MHHHVIPDLFRNQHQQAVEIQITLTAAASPAGALVPDGYVSAGHPHSRRQTGYPFRNIFHRFLSHPFQLFLCKGRQGLLSRVRQMLEHPGLLTPHEGIHIPFLHPYRIVEGNKERLQSFRGVVIQIKGSGRTKMFTIRKVSNGVGVERIFPLYSPHIDKIEVNKYGVVRRARIYYLRDLTGKKARIKERRVVKKANE